MAQPGRAPKEVTSPIDLYWNLQQGYYANPQNPDLDLNSTAQLNAFDRACSMCFKPTTTPFGARQDLKLKTPINIPVGPTYFKVSYCITDYGSTCTPPSPADNSTGTIKVGSGPEGGR